MGNICEICSKEGAMHSPLDKLERLQAQSEPHLSTKSTDLSENEAPKRKQLSDFEVIKMLGRGAFGMVVLCREIPSKRLFAMKMLPKKKFQNTKLSKDRLMTERKILLESKHPRIVKMYCAFQDPKYFYFVMEYLEGGQLQEYIDPAVSQRPERVRFYAAQVLEGLLYLHTKKIIYRDLKPENLLLDRDGNAKLSDFGLAKNGTVGVSFCGTPEYIAPEILESGFTRPAAHAQRRPVVLRLLFVRAGDWEAPLQEPLRQLAPGFVQAHPPRKIE